MANVQKQLEQFHAAIRTDFEMSSTLREKRDIVVNRIKKYLVNNNLPGVTELLQGSYKMKTGVKPIGEREYDIDIGLRFDFDEDAHTVKDVRGWVFDAVKGHTKKIEDKGPCIRVVYEGGYHLDLVAYAVWDEHGNNQYRLAHKSRGWVEADPPKLLEYIDEARKPFIDTKDDETKTDQFRRVVRYLRRWDDVAIPKESRAKPSGLAFVLLCRDRLVPALSIDQRSDDSRALLSLAEYCSNLLARITAKKPTPEYEELFASLSSSEMTSLKTRFADLAEALREASAEVDPVKACEILRKQFGEDFPVPDPEDTAKKSRAPAVVTSSSSA